MKLRCPHCEQYKLVPRNQEIMLVAGVMAGSVIIAIGVFLLPITFILYIVAFFTKGLRCTNCGWMTKLTRPHWNLFREKQKDL